MYTFSKNIKVKKLSNNNILLLDTKVGAWCITTKNDLSHIEIINSLLNSGKSAFEKSPYFSILETLYSRGLVSKNEKFIYENAHIDHSKNKVNTIILKVVGHCNLACSYCYDYNSVRYKLKMPFEKAKQAIDGVWGRSGDNLNILFHGGEPMLEKKLIFKIVEYVNQKRLLSNKRIKFSIQTNGTQFDDEWVEHLLSNNYSIGVSLDGDEKINDINRYYHNKKGSFRKIISTINSYPQLKERVGILTTVTKTNVNNLFEIAKFFQELGFKTWKSILYQTAGRSIAFDDKLHPDSIEIVNSYLKLFEGIENGDFPKIKIASISSYIENVLYYKRTNMCLRSNCGAGSDLVSISVDGTIEACDCITNIDYRLGKLSSAESISTALDSTVAQAIRSRNVESLFQCSNCDWRKFCGGTCLAKAGRLDKVEPTECLLSLNLFEKIFESLNKSNSLIDYVNTFSKGHYFQEDFVA